MGPTLADISRHLLRKQLRSTMYYVSWVRIYHLLWWFWKWQVWSLWSAVRLGHTHKDLYKQEKIAGLLFSSLISYWISQLDASESPVGRIFLRKRTAELEERESDFKSGSFWSDAACLPYIQSPWAIFSHTTMGKLASDISLLFSLKVGLVKGS